MSSRGRIFRITLAVLVLASITWFAVNYKVEWYEERVDLGYSEPARKNSLLAAELFLLERGIEVESVPGLGLLDNLPGKSDLIILGVSRRLMSERRQQNLIDWIEAGGQVVVAAEAPSAAAIVREEDDALESFDSLLEHFAIYPYHPGEDDPLEIDESAEENADEIEETARDVESDLEPDIEDTTPGERLARDADEIEAELREFLDVAVAGKLRRCRSDPDTISSLRLIHNDDEDQDEGEEIELELDAPFFLVSPGDSSLRAQGRNGTQLIQQRTQSGVITAVTSLAIFDNQNIHCRDHAYLLWSLSRDAERIWILHDPDLPNLAQLIFQGVPMTATSVVALLLLWAASRTIRFGPPLSERPGERRELFEHLEASSRFLWRRRQLGSAVATLRGEIHDRNRGVRRDWGSGRLADSNPALAKISGLPETEIELTVNGAAPSNRRAFVQIVRELQAQLHPPSKHPRRPL